MKKNITNIIELLKQEYPEATCSLDFTSPWEMAIAVVLSAQCTDERVNKITPNIFAKYKTPKDVGRVASCKSNPRAQYFIRESLIFYI